MNLFKRKKPQTVVQTANNRSYCHPFYDISSYVPFSENEIRLYDALKESIPIIDAAIKKTVRLVGGFKVCCDNKATERRLGNFLKNVKVNGCEGGIESFISNYLEQAMTYGTAVGEIVVSRDGKRIEALYNANLHDIELVADTSPLDVKVCRREFGQSVPVKYQQLILLSTLAPKAGSIYGTSVLSGLPFVSGILLKIYNSIGANWERVGNVRFAVTYKPTDSSDRAFSRERAQQIATEWSKAMHGRDTADFVSVGDVSIKVIGADNQVLDSEIPVRQMLEQIVAKLSVPPFLLGLNWSSTERMSSQQADILTSELEYYRRLLEPVILKICNFWLRINGCTDGVSIEWDNISLQDEVELASARLQNANAQRIELENENMKGSDF